MKLSFDVISELKECREGIISLHLCTETGKTQQINMLYEDTLEHINNIHRWFLQNTENFETERTV